MFLFNLCSTDTDCHTQNVLYPYSMRKLRKKCFQLINKIVYYDFCVRYIQRTGWSKKTIYKNILVVLGEDGSFVNYTTELCI
jgi:hypothetical protein